MSFVLISVGEHFTPAVYWHYINTQYFPISVFASGKEINSSMFFGITQKLEAVLNEPKVDQDSLGSTKNSLLKPSDRECDDRTKSVDKNVEKEPSDNLTIDQIITRTEDELKTHQQNFDIVKSNISKRINDSLDIDKAVDANTLNLASGKLEEYKENIYSTYTKASLQCLKEYAGMSQDDNDNIMRDSIYPNSVDCRYFECIERKLRKQGIAETHNPTVVRKKCSQTIKEGEGAAVTTRSRDRGLAHVLDANFHDAELNEMTAAPRKIVDQQIKKGIACQVCNEDFAETNNKVLSCCVSLFILMTIELSCHCT